MENKKNKNGKVKTIEIPIAIFLLLSVFAAFATPASAQVTVSIRDITVSATGESVTEPIMLNGITNYGTGTINVTYNASIVHVTDVTSGPDSTVITWNPDNVTGVVRISAWNLMGVSGDIIFANVEYTAVGSADDSSPLNIDIVTLKDTSYADIPATPINGSFTIEAAPDTTPPSVTSPTALTDPILSDTGRPRPAGTNETTLAVKVTDDVGVKSVTIDLSPIGGSPTQAMTKQGATDWYAVDTTATIGVNLTHTLMVNATDTSDNFNDAVGISLTVLRRGDVVRDNSVDMGDALYIARWTVGLEAAPSVLVGDVIPDVGDGTVDMADALYIARYSVGLEVEP